MTKMIVLFGLILSSVALGEAEVPHSFEAGQPARAAEINANFDSVVQSIKSADTSPPEITILETRCITPQERPSSLDGWSLFGANLMFYRVLVSDDQELSEVFPGNNVRFIENNDSGADIAFNTTVGIDDGVDKTIYVFPNIKQIDYSVYIYPLIHLNRPYPFAESGNTHMLIVAKDSRGNIGKLVEQHPQECFDENPAEI